MEKKGMKILRLLLFQDCKRKCPDCSNQYFDIANLPFCDDFSGYDQIILTGGEPMLRPFFVITVAQKIRKQTDAPIYMYTADTSDPMKMHYVLKYIDGITVTLHDQWDAEPFLYFLYYLKKYPLESKSLRLNVFEGIAYHKEYCEGWQIKEGVHWIKNCPLPENEVLMRLPLK